MAEAYLDALLLELDRSTDDDRGEAQDDPTVEDNDVGSQPAGGEGGEQPPAGIVPLAPDPGQAVDAGSPVHRSPIIGKYITSSSARRKVLKISHCNFCQQEHTRESLELHLQQSDRCKTLYLRKLHLKTIDAILCSLFECLFCPDRAPKLFNHLEANNQCKLQYLAKFNVLSSREACDKVQKLKRTGFKSRRSLSRSIENVKAKKSRFEEKKNEPLETSLNDHLNRNLFSNFRTCIGCQCNVTSAEEVTNDSECVMNGSQTIANKSYLMRLKKFWLCKHCSSEKTYTKPDSPLVMRSLEDDESGETVYFLLRPEDREGHDLNPAELEFVAENSKKVFLFFPCSTESLKIIPAETNLRSLSLTQIQNLLYSTDPFDNKIAASLYEHQVLKYQKAKQGGEFFSGKILDFNARTLSGVQVCSQESRITGSDSWRRGKISELKWKRKQLGKICLKVSVTFPFDDFQTIATHLVQRGNVVSEDLRGGETGELNRTYLVHTGEKQKSFLIFNLFYLKSYSRS